MADQVNHSKFNVYEFFLSTKTAKTYTNLGVSLILVILLVFLALMPTINTIDKIKDKITIYEDLNAKVEKKVSAAINLNEQINIPSTTKANGLRDEIIFLNKVFFADEDLVNLYSNLQKRASENKVAITSFSPKYQPATSTKSFDRTNASPSTSFFEITLGLEGTNISDVENFISTLEGHNNLPIFSRLKAVNVKVGADGSNNTDEDLLNANVVLMVYKDNTKRLQATNQ